MAVVRDLVTRLGFQVDNRGRTRAEGAITNIRDRANDAAMQVRGMLAAFVGFQGLRGISNIADNVQSLEARMGQMTQTVGTAGEAFDAVAARATAARQDLDAYANLYIRIGNATQGLIKDQNSLLGVIDTISQAMVVGGVASSEQASAMLQLSQAFNKGKLDGDEFRAVMEAMPRAFTEGLAGAMGYTDGLASFMEASRNGELTTDMLVEALQQIGPSIRDQFLAMPMTLSQSFTIINNRFSTFIARMNRESQAVSKVAGFFLSAFDRVEQGVEKVIDALGGYEQALKLIGIALGAIALPVALKVLAGAFALLVSPIGLVVGGLTLLGLAIEDVYQWMNGGESVIGRWLGPFEQWRKSTVDGFQNVIDRFNALDAAIGGVARNFWGRITFNEDLMKQGMSDVEKYLPILLDGMADKIKHFIYITPWGKWFLDALWQGIKHNWGIYMGALNDLAPQWMRDLLKLDATASPDGVQPAPVYGPAVPVVPPMGNNTNVYQTINVTVPPGTPEQQQQALKDGAAKAYGDPMNKLTNNMSVYGR